jgi:pyruvate formate lyase activating enzyme
MFGYSTGTCQVCLSTTSVVPAVLKICASCITKRFSTLQTEINAIHAATRAVFDLPALPPEEVDGVTCNHCANHCSIVENERGFCGLRKVRNGRLVNLAGTPGHGLLRCYHDPLPTNCVADWICEGHKHPTCHNLAVFYESCTMNCLFCQNWHFRRVSPGDHADMSAEELAAEATPSTFCVCFFGGDPSSQMPHALAASRLLAEKQVCICWETNGMMNPKYLEKAIDYSIQTRGCMKFDLKAYDNDLHRALTGISNEPVMKNFKRAAERSFERSAPPLVIASTLLVPGYVDTEQVHRIAQYIASLNPEIPYSLLGFSPQFYMTDLPFTSVRHAKEAKAAALDAGLLNVRIANRHLLGRDYAP